MAACSWSDIPDSSLSAPVKKLIDIFRLRCEENSIREEDVYKNCMDGDGNLNWKILQSVFSIDITSESAEWYANAIGNLSPAILRISCAMMQLEEISDDIMSQLQWTGNAEAFHNCFQQMKSGDSVLAMQLMTCILDRALGNVYLIGDRAVPFLLKDLLSCDNLKRTIGECPMQILRVLMGPPVSLNLRNLVWHGFIAPQELPMNFCWFLFAVIIDVGNILKAERFPRRIGVDLPQINELVGKFPILTVGEVRKFEETMHFYRVIPRGLLSSWESALQQFLSKNYKDCVVRLLPLLENVLRRLFAVINGCGERVLTAQSAVFYTTFDEILAQNIGGRENQLRSVVGDNFLIVLNDLLMLPSGPRLRDRLSHGEVDISCITLDLANHVTCIAILACEIAQSRMENEAYYIFELFPTLSECVENYKPVFPLHCTCRLQIEQLVMSLNCWKNCSVLKGNETVSLANLEQIEIEECLPGSLTRFICMNSDMNPLLDSLSSLKLDVLYRSQVELEKIGHVGRICTISRSLSEQIQKNVELQAQRLARREMRSRNRETYNRMLKAIPIIGAAMRITATVLVEEFLNYSNGICNNRLFRCLSYYIDNLKVMTSSQKNRWEESERLTKTFITTLISSLNFDSV